MKHQYIKRFIIFYSLLMPLHAEEIDYLELSLTELLEVEVYTANQEVEKAASSAAITSVISSEQLRQWGANNLYEALSFLPGIVLNETYIGYTVLTFRGVTPGLYNNKALFMINGQPVFERLFGSSHLEYIPIEMVERIEVVRSPASALYGSNAVSGVVNVITKQTGNQVSIKTGSNNQQYISISHHEDNFSISASSLRDDGYSYSGTNDEQGKPVNFDYNDANDNIFIDYHPEGWRINASYFQQEKSKFGLNPLVFQHGNNRQEAFNLSINRHLSLGNGILNTWLRYDKSDKELDAEAFPAPTNNPVINTSSVYRISAEIQYKETLTPDTNYIVGITGEKDMSDPMLFIDQITGKTTPQSPFFEEKDFHNFAIYSQLKHSFSNVFSSVIGLRYENNSDSGSGDVIPRIGLTYELSRENFLKFLYSEAFRQPVFLEKYIDIENVLVGDTNLKRERIRTAEIAIDSRLNKNNKLEATIYWLKLFDEITRRPAPVSGTEYYNAPGREMQGIEIEWKSVLNQKSNLNINGSYTNGDEDIFGSTQSISSYTLNMMYNYKLSKTFEISLSNQTIGPKNYVLTDNSEGKVDGYNLTNVILNYKKSIYETTLTFKNIFSEKYTYPEPVRRNIAEIPGGPEASVYLKFSIYY